MSAAVIAAIVVVVLILLIALYLVFGSKTSASSASGTSTDSSKTPAVPAGPSNQFGSIGAASATTSGSSSAPTTQTVTFCESTNATASCPPGQKMTITKAQYYRPVSSTCGGAPWAGRSCPGADFTAATQGYVNGGTLDTGLSGGNSFNVLKGFNDPCPNILKQFDVTYTCQ